MEDLSRARCVGTGVELPYTFRGPLPTNLQMLTNPEAPRVLSLWHDSDRAHTDFLAVFDFPGEISLDQVMLRFTREEIQETGWMEKMFYTTELLWCLPNHSRDHP